VKVRGVLDTHALIWAAQDPDRLGTAARRLINSAAPGELVVTSHSVVELGRLIDRGAVEVDGRASEWFAPVFRRFPAQPASLEAAIAAPVLRLPYSDPFDRLIVAEALALREPLLTNDGNITDSGVVRVVW
jgi:PIN domain nuclease of toxin-antitoxin system